MTSRRKVVLAIPAWGSEILRGVGLYVQRFGQWELRLSSELEGSFQTAPEVRADGLIAQPLHAPFAEYLAGLGIPVVSVSDAAEFPLPTVHSDNLAIGRQQAEYLLGRGFRHLAYSGGRRALFSLQRHQGFRKAIEARGLLCYDVRTLQDLEDADTAAWLLDQLRSLPRPLGLAACSDVRASAIAELCYEHDIEIPGQLAVLGVDNNEVLCNLHETPLSSVETSFHRIGYEAALLLSRLMNGEPPPERPILVPPGGIVSRRSTDVHAVDDPEVALAIQYIRANYDEAIQVPQVASHVAISRRNLDRLFVRALGQTVADYITRLRLDRACDLLRNTEMTLLDVALATGFTDHHHLGRAFRRELGETPSDYRTRYRIT